MRAAEARLAHRGGVVGALRDDGSALTLSVLSAHFIDVDDTRKTLLGVEAKLEELERRQLRLRQQADELDKTHAAPPQ